jgi:hypothetical protein
VGRPHNLHTQGKDQHVDSYTHIYPHPGVNNEGSEGKAARGEHPRCQSSCTVAKHQQPDTLGAPRGERPHCTVAKRQQPDTLGAPAWAARTTATWEGSCSTHCRLANHAHHYKGIGRVGIRLRVNAGVFLKHYAQAALSPAAAAGAAGITAHTHHTLHSTMDCVRGGTNTVQCFNNHSVAGAG